MVTTKQDIVNNLNNFYGTNSYLDFNKLSFFEKELGVLLSVANPPTKQDIVNSLNAFYGTTIYTDFNSVPIEEIRFALLMNLISTGLGNGEGGGSPTPQTTITKSYIAATDLTAYRAVRINNSNQLIYADNNNPQLVGVITQNYTAGQLANVVILGSVYNAAWLWDITKLVYVGNDGILTQIPPNTGYAIQIGDVLDSSTINIDVDVIAL